MARSSVGQLKRLTVIFVYGAADRSGVKNADELRPRFRDVGIDIGTPIIVDWGKYAVNPRVADVDALLRNRFGDTDAAAKSLIDKAIETKLGEAVWANWIATHLDTMVLSAFRTGASMSFPVISDALSYEKRSAQIINFTQDQFALVARTTKHPIIVIGLSLGGIIAVDSLSDPRLLAGDRQVIRLLITVGSQSPALLACDALQYLRRDRSERGKLFTPWLNIWRRLDLLSFAARPMFATRAPDSLDLRDVDIDDPESPALFPDCHLTYFEDAQFYRSVRQMLVDRRIMEAPPGTSITTPPEALPALERKTRRVERMLESRPEPSVAGWPRRRNGAFHLKPG